MAIDLITESSSSLAPSPRISFSNDLRRKSDAEEDFLFGSDSSLVDSNSDFDFCISLTETETSSADELFSDGLIRPLQLQERFVISKSFSVPTKLHSSQAPSLPPLPPTSEESSKQEDSKEIINTETEGKQQQSKSFWRIKRSSSVHCDSSHKKSSFWSLPLLSRSNSTGSITKAFKEGQKQNSNLKPQQQQRRLTGSASTPGSANNFYTYPLSKKPPLKKNYGGGVGGGSRSCNGVRINPVLHVPPPYNIKGTANLFGFGSLLRNGKEKKSKK